MNYRKAGWIAIIKRVIGWLVFIPALLSTLISLMNFVYQHSEKSKDIKGMYGVILDFSHVIVDVVRSNTSFLDMFWLNSPVPDLAKSVMSSHNVLFIIIYLLIFVGLALQASGARMSRQVKYVREGIEDQLILEQAKENAGQTREQLESRISLPHHSIFLQYFPLYILPIIIGVIIYIVLKLFSQLSAGM